MNKNNLSIVRQQFAQCVFNHKVWEKASDRAKKYDDIFAIMDISVLCLIIVFLILELKFSGSFIFGGISISLGVFDILFKIVQKEFSFKERSKEYKKFALKFLELRDKYKNFLVDIMNDLEDEKVIDKRDLLQNQYQIICDLSLDVNKKDYEEAQLSLLGTMKRDEEYTWSDREINRFLSEELRI